jgi:hypothetical protein
MRMVEVDEVPVVLSRSESGEVCYRSGLHPPGRTARRGGAGRRRPWHGSRFDLCSGEAVRVPASVPQQRFEVRVRDGWVEVRPT